MQRAWHHLSFYRPVFRAHYAATTSALLLVFLSLFLIFIALVVYGQVKETREALEKFSYISNLIAISSILLGISALILISTVSHGIYIETRQESPRFQPWDELSIGLNYLNDGMLSESLDEGACTSGPWAICSWQGLD